MRLIERAESLPVVPVHLRPLRGAGVHLSDIVHDLCVTLDPDRFRNKDDAEEFAELDEVPIIFMGMAFEDRLERTLDLQQPCAFRPPEITYSGVLMNADRLVWEGEQLWSGFDLAGVDMTAPVVEEHKLTRMSGNSDIEGPKFAHYFYQLKFYCAGYGTRRGRLRAFFQNADYRYGQTPASDPRSRNYRVWDILFSPQELSDNTRMLVQHARKRGWL